MANIPQDLSYTEEHEYVRRTGEPGVVEIGITDYAQGELGDVVFVELPKVGASLGRIEVVAVNDALDANPALVNSDPYGEGWMVRLRVSDPAELDRLMDAAAYESHIG
jgi:glycine cleavage system H protein